MSKIDISYILGACPDGMHLYSSVCGECFLKTVTGKGITVTKEHFGSIGTQEYSFSRYGEYMFESGLAEENSECVLFPSYTQRNWDDFEIPHIFQIYDYVIASDGPDGVCYQIVKVDKNGYDAYYCSDDGNSSNIRIMISQQNNWKRVSKFVEWKCGCLVFFNKFLSPKKLINITDDVYEFEDGFSVKKTDITFSDIRCVLIPSFKVGDRIINKNDFSDEGHTISSVIHGFYDFTDGTYIAIERQFFYKLCSPHKFNIGDIVKQNNNRPGKIIEINERTGHYRIKHLFTDGAFTVLFEDEDELEKVEPINDNIFKEGDLVTSLITNDVVYEVIGYQENGDVNVKKHCENSEDTEHTICKDAIPFFKILEPDEKKHNDNFDAAHYIKEWSFDDAKCGDVLMSVDGNPFVYNGRHTERSCGCLIGINKYGQVVVGSEDSCNWASIEEMSDRVIRTVYPATELDKELFYNRMYDAGYLFDFDSRKLQEEERKWKTDIKSDFKKGDICVCISGKSQYIFLFDHLDEHNKVRSYAIYCQYEYNSSDGLFVYNDEFNGFDYGDYKFRYAVDCEKNKFNEVLTGSGYAISDSGEVLDNFFEYRNLKPFDKILCLDSESIVRKWSVIDLFKCIDDSGMIVGMNGKYDTVLPYEGNENFLMTGYAVPDYYRVGLEIIKRK